MHALYTLGGYVSIACDINGVDSFLWTLNILILRSPQAPNTSPVSGWISQADN